MNPMPSERFLRKLAVLLLAVAVPILVGGQQKKDTKPAPPPKASTPAKPSTPSGNASTHPTGTGTSTMGHGTGTNAMGHGTTTTTHNGTGTAGKAGGMNTGGKTGGMAGGAANASHGSTRMATNHIPPGKQVSLRGGGSASIRPNGQIRSINRNGMQIQRGMHGGRTIVSTHNGVRVVSVGRGGYVQRAYFTRGGRSYYSRTYYYHGAYRVGVYRGYYWGGRPYYGYYPAYYYHPVYYGWAYNPWPAPVYYGWGWGAAPWYGYYGPYYAPYPVYPSAAFWLTDFMIAASLQAAYAAQANAWLEPFDPNRPLVASLIPIAPADAKPAMTPEVKNELAEEVKIILAAEQAEADKSKGASAGAAPASSNEAPPALDPKFRTFVVSSDMSLVADGDECALSQGDVITRTSDTPDDDGNVTVKVVASTKSDCAIGAQGPVSVDDLQEMYNGFRDQLKDGMAELAKKQGTAGLPKAPDTSTTDGDVPAPPPDKSAEKNLQDQQSAADQAESQAKQEAGSGSGGGLD